MSRARSSVRAAARAIGRLKMRRTLDPKTGQKLLQVVRRYDGKTLDQEGSLVTVQHRLARRARG